MIHLLLLFFLNSPTHTIHLVIYVFLPYRTLSPGVQKTTGIAATHQITTMPTPLIAAIVLPNPGNDFYNYTLLKHIAINVLNWYNHITVMIRMIMKRMVMVIVMMAIVK